MLPQKLRRKLPKPRKKPGKKRGRKGRPVTRGVSRYRKQKNQRGRRRRRQRRVSCGRGRNPPLSQKMRCGLMEILMSIRLVCVDLILQKANRVEVVLSMTP